MHAYRVLVFAYLIGSIEWADMESLCYASIFHDVRRYNDGYDLDHGKRAANWVRKNFDLKNKEKVEYLIQWHVSEDCDDITLDLKCFKDADSLDRWREGDLDERCLRTEAARSLLDFSKKFFELTKLDSEKDSKRKVIDALKKLDALS